MNYKAISIWILILGLFLMSMVWMRINSVKTGREIKQFRSQLNFKKERNKHLEFDVRTLKSPENIENFVQKNTKMTLPEPSKIIVLDDIKPAKK
jgi:cell division protein FtsL